MQIIFIVGAIQAFFLTALLLTKKKKQVADKVLAIWLLLIAISLFSYYAEVVGLDTQYPAISFFAFSYGMLIGALTFVYVHVLTRRQQEFNWHLLLHGLPYVFFTIVMYFKLSSHGNPDWTAAIHELEDTRSPLMVAQTITNVFLGPVYMIISLITLRKHDRLIHQDFSYTENIDLKWLKNVIVGMIAVMLVVITMNLSSNYTKVIPWRIADNIIQTCLVLLVFYIGYHGVKQQVIFSPAPVTQNNKGKSSEVKSQYVKSSLTDKESKEYLDVLLKYMKEEQPYLDGKLSLAQVADSLDLSTNHLSQVINSQLNKNFFDFINGYRVELIKKKMTDKSNGHLTLLGMAYDSGFNSKSSFNSIFKKFTDTTPSQFIRSQRA
jgi:AraC-like DNA-binding protein